MTFRGPDAYRPSRNNGKLSATTPLVQEPSYAEDFSTSSVAISSPPSFERSRRTPSPASQQPVALPADLPGIETMGAIAQRAASAIAIQENQSMPAVETNQTPWQEMWQQNDLPDELSITQLTTPREVRDVVAESFSHFMAVQVSTLEYEDSPQQPSREPVPSDTGLLPQGHAPLLPVLVETPQEHNGSSSSGSSTDSTHASSPSPSSSSSQSVESFTTAGSNLDILLAKSHQQSDDQMPHLNLLSPLSPYGLGKDLERRAKKHGITKIFRGKEDPFRPSNRKRLMGDPNSALAKPIPSPPKECASCFDDVPVTKVVSLACQHSYCPECFAQLITTAMQHENFWPPKCCLQEIPQNTIETKLSALQLANYRLKAKEYATPAGERWYCAKPECAKWFSKSKARAQDATVSCSHCNFKMCLFCRGASHAAGERCRQDSGLEATLAAAELEGWRQCYRCHTMVELQSGCRHITCKCSAEFW